MRQNFYKRLKELERIGPAARTGCPAQEGMRKIPSKYACSNNPGTRESPADTFCPRPRISTRELRDRGCELMDAGPELERVSGSAKRKR
jgi:hypothetical protein